MKKETKELFEDLRALTKIAYYSLNSGLSYLHLDEYKTLYLIDELENKLKEMEIYLTKGGIILDKNDNQCKVGDKVCWIDDEVDLNKGIEQYNGELVFRDDLNRLFIISDNNEYFNPIKKNFNLIDKK